MRGKVAKAIRRHVYGDMSLKAVRRYKKLYKRVPAGKGVDGKPIYYKKVTVLAVDLRRRYQEMKRDYYRFKRLAKAAE